MIQGVENAVGDRMGGVFALVARIVAEVVDGFLALDTEEERLAYIEQYDDPDERQT